MRSGGTSFRKIAFVLCSVAALQVLRAADSQPAAPEKIEFSRSSSTTPKVPRPGAKNEELLNRFGNVPNAKGDNAPPVVNMINQGVPVFSSKAAAERFLRDFDRKKNWAVPGAQDDIDSTEGIEKTDKLESKWDMAEKDGSVMQDYLSGKGSNKRTSAQGRERESDRDRDDDRRIDRGETDRRGNDRDRGSGESRSDNRGDKYDEDPRRDPDDNSQSNGLAEFNLKNFIRAQNGQPTFVKDNPLPSASQLFRSEIGNSDSRLTERERAEIRDRDAARSAAFMQMLKPRTTGSMAGGSDPVNAPDMTRREMNPVIPRMTDTSSGSGRSPFATPPPSSSGPRENSMFGITGPAASSIAPTVSIPASRPEIPRSRDSTFIHEAPRRQF